jgi:hypothetical protein
MLGKALLGLVIYWNWARSPSALVSQGLYSTFALVSPEFGKACGQQAFTLHIKHLEKFLLVFRKHIISMNNPLLAKYIKEWVG